MAKLALIGPQTVNESVNDINDIVGTFPDDWNFTDKEKALFNIVDRPETVEEVESKKPAKKRVYKSKTTEWTEDEPEKKEVWLSDDGKYYELKKLPKYELSLNDKSEIVKNHSKYPENLETEVEVS